MLRRYLRLAACAIPGLLPARLTPQQSAGTELWRLAAATVPVPQALATGAAAAFWNPAQRDDGARALLGVEAIQTPDAIDASGFLAALRVRVGGRGTLDGVGEGGMHLGLVYGRMQLDGLVRTYVSPDPDQGTVPFFTHTLGTTAAFVHGATTFGATVAFHETRLDRTDVANWTLDAGIDRRINDVLRVAAATHFFSRASSTDPGQDIYGGIEYRVFRGPLWSGGVSSSIRARYGLVFAHGFGADHQLGAGIEFGDAVAFDLMAARDGGYAGATWRAVAGLRVRVGRYRLSFARDGGVEGLGSAVRVGLETRLR
jgi:hypothetical protein